MICPECSKFVSPFDEKCQHCGNMLKDNPMKDYVKKADKIVDDGEQRVKAEIDRLTDFIESINRKMGEENVLVILQEIIIATEKNAAIKNQLYSKFARILSIREEWVDDIRRPFR